MAELYKKKMLQVQHQHHVSCGSRQWICYWTNYVFVELILPEYTAFPVVHRYNITLLGLFTCPLLIIYIYIFHNKFIFKQHGTVYWNKGSQEQLKNLRPDRFLHEQLCNSFANNNSPIWMDSSTSCECKILENTVGGPSVRFKFNTLSCCYFIEFIIITKYCGITEIGGSHGLKSI